MEIKYKKCKVDIWWPAHLECPTSLPYPFPSFTHEFNFFRESKKNYSNEDIHQIEAVVRQELGEKFDLYYDTPEKRNTILKELQETLNESDVLNFDRWKCARCIVANLALAAAITAAISAFGPASPSVIPYVMDVFGLSKEVAEAVVYAAKVGASTAQVAKKVCGSC